MIFSESEIAGEAATGNTEALPYVSNENGQNGTTVVEDTPAVVDNHAPRSSGRKRKTPDRFGVLKPTPDSNKKVDILLEAKEEEEEKMRWKKGLRADRMQQWAWAWMRA